MLYDKPRWCLWLKEASPEDVKASPILRERLGGVREARLSSPTKAVQDLSSTPGVFAQDRQPNCQYLAFPEVSSENRDYIPATFYEPEVVAGNKLIVLPDPPLWLFGVLQSAAFTRWLKTFAGRLKSDVSISPGLTYFTFPFAEIDDTTQRLLEERSAAVLDARAAHPSSNLATLYDPLAMPANLRAAHNALDKVVDGLYRLKNPTEGERLRALLARYTELTTADQLDLSAAPAKPKRKAVKRKSKAG